MSNVNNTTPATITSAKKPSVARLHAASARANAVIAATGSAVVSGVRAGHGKGCEYVAFTINKIDGTSFLVRGDSAEGAMAIAKEIAKTTTRGLLKIIAVPVAYLAGFTYGFWKEVYTSLKESYKAYKSTKLETKLANIEEDPQFKQIMAEAAAKADIIVQDNVDPNA